MAKCPKCETPLELTPAVLGEQMLSLRMTWEGEMMQAKTIAGTIDGTRKLLEMTAKDMGAKCQVFVHKIDQRDKELQVDFILCTEYAKGKAP